MPRKPSPLAAILFTSGSSAAPKGVPLSHDNILSNCRDVAAILALDSHDAMLAMLPPFHTLGLTGNIVLPLVLGAVTGTLGLLCIRGEQRIVDWLHRRRDKLAPK